MKIFDLHCDTLYKYVEYENYSIKQNDGHITEKSLLEGEYLAQCFAVFVPKNIYGQQSFLFFQKQFELYQNILNQSDVLKSAKSFEDITNNRKNNKVSAVLTLENAELLNGEIDRISYLQECGVKILGLIHNDENCIGFSHTNPNMPLKDFGRDVVDAVNNSNMFIDVSHLNYAGFWDVANLCKKPFVATHSCCRALFEHTRNLDDKQIKAVANSGGFVGINFFNRFFKNKGKTEIFDIIAHLEHLIKVGGEDVAAIGTDFDGIECEMFIKNCAEMPVLINEIEKKFGARIAEKICYKNALRIF